MHNVLAPDAEKQDGAELLPQPRDPDALSPKEAETLGQLEATIKRGLKSFVVVGQALKQIQEQQLYRAKYSTFEWYLSERWGLKRQRAYELIEAATITTSLSEISDAPPAVESHAAALAAAPEIDRPKIWKEANDTAPNGKVTAKHVEKVVKAHRAKCSNCGHDQFDDDGDCERCKEPAQRPGGTIEKKKRKIKPETKERKRQEGVEAEIARTASSLGTAIREAAWLLDEEDLYDPRNAYGFLPEDGIRDRALAAFRKEAAIELADERVVPFVKEIIDLLVAIVRREVSS
jgi:hypothetical protein